MAELRCVVVTPERAVLDEAADFVALPLYDGELGVLPGRAPLIGRLGAGELRIQKDNHITRYFIDGGFVQVRSNVVTLLTQRAMKADEINPAAAKKALEEAMKPVAGDAAIETAMKAQERARAQLRMAGQSSQPAGTSHA